jgi:hypothetical protein
MATTQIRGNTQIKDGTIEDAQIASDADIATSKLADGAEFLQRDGSVPLTGDLDADTTNTVKNLADPVNNRDAANKQWVLAQLAGFSTSRTVARAIATANVDISNPGTAMFDGVTLGSGDLLLLTGQTAPEENGIYVFDSSSSALVRDTSMDDWSEVPGAIVVIEEGTTYHDTIWLCTSNAGGTLDTTAINFIQIPGPSDVLAGSGLTRSGQTLNVGANADSSIQVNADDIQVKRDGSGAIGVSGSGIAVNTDNSTIEKNSNNLRVKPGGIGETELGSGTYLRIAKYIVRETPSGSVNGSNSTFTLAHTPVVGSEQVYLNGILQEPGSGNDYTISGDTISYENAPLTGDRIRVTYLSQ